VAIKVTAESGLQITAEVAINQGGAFAGIRKVKVIDGKRSSWVKARTGTNLGNHWELEGLAAAHHVASIITDELRQIQDCSFEGSMLDRYPGQEGLEVHGES
jgi:hypothetical protein